MTFGTGQYVYDGLGLYNKVITWRHEDEQRMAAAAAHST
jgi:hypothetical protein